jgi:hypothetical protein
MAKSYRFIGSRKKRINYIKAQKSREYIIITLKLVWGKLNILKLRRNANSIWIIIYIK